MKRVLLGTALAVTMMTTTALQAKTYATVNGQAITDRDIAAILQVIPGARFNQLSPKQRKKIVEQAIEKKLLAENAVKSGIEKDPKFKEALEKVKKDLALEIWMKKQYENVKVSDSEMKAFYDKNKKMFRRPAMAKARHILVKSKKEAEAIIKELNKAKNKEAKFIALAKAKSTGPSGPNGGELGWFDKKRMVKEFSDAAFKLKKGSYTKKPVKTQFGYHVIYLEDIKPAGTVSFEEAKPSIEQSLKVKKFQAKIKEISKKLKSKADIKINN